MDKVKNKVNEIWNSIPDTIEKLKNKVTAKGKELFDGLNRFADDLKEGFFNFLNGCKDFVVGIFDSVVSVLASLINIVAQALIGIVAGLGYLGGMIFGVSPSENDFSKWVETWRGGVNSFFEGVAPNDTVYNVTNSILDMAVSCIPIVGDVRDGVEVITGVNMITGEKLSLAERLITAACFFIPMVGASFVRESGQGVVKFIGKHWDEAMQFASKYIDEGITLLSKHGGDFLMNIAKKGDDLSTLLKRAFNFGDEIEFAGVGTLKGDPEVSTKLQDFVSKITGKVDDVGSGTIKTNDVKSIDKLEINPFDKSGKLKPNIKYKAGEYDYLYETDNMGRISKFETDNLQLTNRDSRLPHNPNTPGKLKGDHAGHLAGDRFGGSPELDNLVSQASNVNLSQYKKIENQWAKAIEEKKM